MQWQRTVTQVLTSKSCTTLMACKQPEATCTMHSRQFRDLQALLHFATIMCDEGNRKALRMHAFGKLADDI